MFCPAVLKFFASAGGGGAHLREPIGDEPSGSRFDAITPHFRANGVYMERRLSRRLALAQHSIDGLPAASTSRIGGDAPVARRRRSQQKGVARLGGNRVVGYPCTGRQFLRERAQPWLIRRFAEPRDVALKPRGNRQSDRSAAGLQRDPEKTGARAVNRGKHAETAAFPWRQPGRSSGVKLYEGNRGQEERRDQRQPVRPRGNEVRPHDRSHTIHRILFIRELQRGADGRRDQDDSEDSQSARRALVETQLVDPANSGTSHIITLESPMVIDEANDRVTFDYWTWGRENVTTFITTLTAMKLHYLGVITATF